MGWRGKHRVTIRLKYIMYRPKKVPWKWTGECTCGWQCLSWYWSDGERGALPMSLLHLKGEL